MKILFNGKIVIVGYGLVGQSFHRLLKDEIDYRNENIFVIEQDINKSRIFVKEGGFIDNFVNLNINEDNYQLVYTKFLSRGDILVDFSINTKNIDSVKWCLKNNVLYLSTSTSTWGNEKSYSSFRDFNNYLKLKETYKDAPTCLIEFGCNPGIVSCFTKQCLENIILNENNLYIRWKRKQLLKLLNQNRFNDIARILKLEYIIISDIDNQQIELNNKEIQTVYNTWNAPGLAGEFFSNSSMVVGSHFDLNSLKSKNILNYIHDNHYVIFKERGINVLFKSHSSKENFEGCIITHDEIFSISKYLTTYKQGKIWYSPSVLFVYRPCETAINSLHSVSLNEQIKYSQINNDQIISGYEDVGVILCGKYFKTKYLGTVVDIKSIKNAYPKETPTIIEVSASCIAGMKYIIKNQNKGLLFPEDLPHKEIMNTAKKYLGEFIYKEIDYFPNFE